MRSSASYGSYGSVCRGPRIVVNIYDLENALGNSFLCCGLYHSGVEIMGVEYCFAQGAGKCGGVFSSFSLD